jgi:hydrogenase nickel incorporation protein HypB
MCRTCGCSPPPDAALSDHAHEHDHAHDASHSHEHDHHDHHHGSMQDSPRVVTLEQRVLERNERIAADNRRWLRDRGVVAINLMAGPGAGKTTLLERTIRDIGAEMDLLVIEGDQATENDALRVRAAGGRAIQINTGAGCHLDAAMVAEALEQLNPSAGALVVIENVGNLVCPALFDLGEDVKVVVVSVADGDDKPLKYPHMFRASDVVLINKIDLLPYVQFDVRSCLARARQVNAHLQGFEVSATRGDGMAAWYAWLRQLGPGSAGSWR